MTHRVRTTGVVALLAGALLSLAGCSGSERPPAASDDIVGADASRGPEGNPIICKASAHRQCKRYFTDASGQQNCVDSHQFCNEAGTAWLECGDFEFDLNGQPIPPAEH